MSSRFRLLLDLRFRLQRHALRKPSGILLAVLLVPLSLGLGALAHASTVWVGERSDPALVAEWTHLTLLLAWLMLAAMPVLGFGGNEFYDVTKLFHLPVSHRTVFAAQSAGLCLGGTNLFFLPALVGLVLGLPGGAGAAAVRLPVLLLFFYHAVTVGQFLQLLLLNLLRSRRLRDLTAVLAALLSAGFYLTFHAFGFAEDSRERILEALRLGLSEWLVPLPSRWVSAVLAPGAGATAWIVFGAIFLPLTALLVFLSAALQERAFHGEVPAARGERSARTRGRARRLPFPLSRLPDDVRAVAGNELLLLRREPVVKTLFINQLAFVIVPVGFGLLAASRPEQVLGFAVYAFLLVETALGLNLLGLDGPGLAHLLAAPISPRRPLAGKVLAYLGAFGALNSVVLAGIGVALAAMGRPLGTAEFLILLLEAWCLLAILLAIGVVASVLLPSPMTARGRRALAQAQTGAEGCGTAVFRGVSLVILSILGVPVALACRLGGPGPWAALAPVWAGALLVAGILLAEKMLRRREEQTIARLAHPG